MGVTALEANGSYFLRRNQKFPMTFWDFVSHTFATLLELLRIIEV